MKKTQTEHPTKAEVSRHVMLYPMLTSALEEMRGLAKKSPDAPLNMLKVQFINQLLDDIRQLLSRDESLGYLSLIDGDTLPLNSDAVLILGRFVAAMDQYKTKHYNAYDYEWITQD